MRGWIDRLKKVHMLSIITTFLVIIVCLIAVLINRQKEAKQASENSYNMAFYELVDYVQNVEVYLAKSLISSTPEHGAETLTNLWREANLAQAYLAQLPIESQELENTERFLNQVSDYSYSLSRKNIYDESLTDDDLKNLKDLHSYSVELENVLNQLSDDLNTGRIKWNELSNKGQVAFAQQVSTSALDGFSSLEENFHEYSGLIYDGAFSEHLTSFSIKTAEENNISISISKKGGHIVYMNSNRDVNTEVISQEEANQKGKEFLSNHGFKNMKETYYLKRDGVVTINYAYIENDVVVYSDLIKVKVALDNGEVLGIETTGYLNNHTKRDVSKIKISKEQAKKTLNKDLQISSEGLAIIPTEYQTEILCYEFKGKVDDRDFLVYINAENGREEDVLIITDTPNGTLTM